MDLTANDAILICCLTCYFCQVWTVLSALDGNPSIRNQTLLPTRAAHFEACSQFNKLNLVRHVHRNYLYEVWTQSGWSHEIIPNDNATRRWAISLYTCSNLISYITAMRFQTPRTLAHHKEESPGRIKADSAGRHKLREKLAQCINPLDPNDHPPALFNIAIGRLAEPSMNIQRALKIWTSSTESFADRAISWPYWQPFHHHVNTQEDNKTWIRPNVWHKCDIRQEIGNHEFV